jgi:glycerol-3-phosphate O-acyltransferase
MPTLTPEKNRPEAFSSAFAQQIRKLSVSKDAKERREITPSDVFQPAKATNRPVFREICDSLMLPGSDIRGVENLLELAERAERGEPGIVLSWHSSNLDVPNLHALLHKSGQAELFDRLVFIAGRKLNEESPLCKAFCETFTRLVVSPPSYFKKHEDDPVKLAQARAVNMAALRKARHLLKQGSLLYLFPTGTRYRSDRPDSARALPQVDGYLRMCKNFVVMNIHGNTLPPVDKASMTDDNIKRDKIEMSIGPVTSVSQFRQRCHSLARQNSENSRQAVADAVMDLIHCL